MIHDSLIEQSQQNKQASLLDQFMTSKQPSLLSTLDDIKDDAFMDEEAKPTLVTSNQTVQLDTTNDEVYGGFYQQRDQQVEQFQTYEDGSEVLSLKEALEKYPDFGMIHMNRIINRREIYVEGNSKG